MSSIYSTLNSVNSSLLTEIGASKTGNAASSGTSSTHSAKPADLNTTDQIDFSQVTKLLKQLQSLQQTNPTEFKQVLSDGATKLASAATAEKTTNPSQANFLNSLAGQFQQAASTGDLSQVRYGLVTGTTAPPSTNLFSYIQAQQDSSSDTQNLLTSIFNTGSANTTNGQSTSGQSASGQISNLLLGLIHSGT